MPKLAPKPAAKTAPAPAEVELIDPDFADFTIPLATADEPEPETQESKELMAFLDSPIFEEEEPEPTGTEEDDLMSDLLITPTASEEDAEDIDDDLSDLLIAKAPEPEPEPEPAPKPAPAPAKPAPPAKKAKPAPADPVQDMSRAELKIQIIQDEPEESYIIPEKYLKMIEDVDNDDEDDFSYLLADVGDIGDDDDMDMYAIETPVMPKAPARRQSLSNDPPLPEQEQYTRYAAKPE